MANLHPTTGQDAPHQLMNGSEPCQNYSPPICISTFLILSLQQPREHTNAPFFQFPTSLKVEQPLPWVSSGPNGRVKGAHRHRRSARAGVQVCPFHIFIRPPRQAKSPILIFFRTAQRHHYTFMPENHVSLFHFPCMLRAILFSIPPTATQSPEKLAS